MAAADTAEISIQQLEDTSERKITLVTSLEIHQMQLSTKQAEAWLGRSCMRCRAVLQERTQHALP